MPPSSCKVRVVDNAKMWLSTEQAMLPATAYGMLAVAAIWSFLFQYFTLHHVISFGILAIGLYLFTGLFGAWHYVKLHQKTPTSISECFRVTKFVSNLYSLPIILSDLYMKYNFSFELVVAHLILPLLALVPCGSNVPGDKTLLNLKRYSPQTRFKETMDFVIFCSLVSLIMVSILGVNWFGLMAAFVYAITQFVVTEEGYLEWFKMPAEPIYVFGMGVFCLLGMRAMVAAY